MKLNNLTGVHKLSGIEVATCEFDPGYEDVDGVTKCVMFTLDGITYMVKEDPDDGYRSYCTEVEEVDHICRTKLPDVRVLCVHIDSVKVGQEDDLLAFIEIESGTIILKIGTICLEDYYPICVLNWEPERLAVNRNNGEGAKV